MITDKQLEFSDSQALTATAVSDNVIDLGYAGADAGTGETLYVVVHFETAFGGTSPTFQLELEESADNSTYTDVVVSKELSAAPDDGLLIIPVPRHSGRYLRLNYVLGGTSPTVTVSSSIADGPQAWKSYPDALAKIQ